MLYDTNACALFCQKLSLLDAFDLQHDCSPILLSYIASSGHT